MRVGTGGLARAIAFAPANASAQRMARVSKVANASATFSARAASARDALTASRVFNAAGARAVGLCKAVIPAALLYEIAAVVRGNRATS